MYMLSWYVCAYKYPYKVMCHMLEISYMASFPVCGKEGASRNSSLVPCQPKMITYVHGTAHAAVQAVILMHIHIWWDRTHSQSVGDMYMVEYHSITYCSYDGVEV